MSVINSIWFAFFIICTFVLVGRLNRHSLAALENNSPKVSAGSTIVRKYTVVPKKYCFDTHVTHPVHFLQNRLGAPNRKEFLLTETKISIFRMNRNSPKQMPLSLIVSRRIACHWNKSYKPLLLSIKIA